jgi:HPt (histidine-containing phosphotransfer) domain-containing protein
LRKRADGEDDARLMRDELDALPELDEQNGGKVAQALREGRYETAVRLYHEIAGNSGVIEVTRLGIDEHDTDEPLAMPPSDGWDR